MNDLGSGNGAATGVDLARIRERFPIFAHRIHLNSCSYGALSTDVEEAIRAYLHDRHAHGTHWAAWTGKLEAVRARVATLIGVPPIDVAVTGSVTEAVNALASALAFDGRRRNIVTTAFDFPTTAQIWRAQAPRGARIRLAEAGPDGRQILLGAFDALIDEETLLVSVPYVCYWNGARLDVARIIEMAHARGALVMVDAYQALGTFPIDARALGADFLVSGFLKYLIGASGVAFLYARDSRALALEPLATGWFAQERIDDMDIFANRPARSARRFEGGTPSVPGLFAVEAGLRLIGEVGLEVIDRQRVTLTTRIEKKASAAGLTLATPSGAGDHGAMIAIRARNDNAMVEVLGEAGIVVSSRHGNVRVSPHFYNNEADIDRLFEVLLAHRRLLA
jgi:selenocysteine lyase/cysteine desulfurase